MPVVGIPVGRLRALLGRDIGNDELLRELGHLGCDVEGFTELARVRCTACGTIHERTAQEEIPPACDACGANLREGHEELSSLEVIRMELLAVRPDMFDPGGLARALRGTLGIETGAPRYPLGPARARITVDPGVRRPESYRPWIVAAVVENFTLDEDALKIVMKLQENLHWAIGRDRKHASIGVYDFDTVDPELIYTVEDPDAFRFVPLGAGGAAPWSLREILAKHPKGVGYAHLLAKHDRYPILKDRQGRVLSMPPIINSEQTRVTAKTGRFVIDVTGLTERTVSRALNVIVTSLLENLPGATASAVEIVGPGSERRTTPDWTLQRMDLDPARAQAILGIPLALPQTLELLGRMRHDPTALSDGRVQVSIPVYRSDILHEMDLVEDLAIGYGYHNIVPSLVPTFTVGGERAIEKASDRAREIFCGLGFSEVMTLSLTNSEEHDRMLGRPESEETVQVKNPVSIEQSILRASLLPGLLDVFRRNVIHPLPQRIFEVGDVTRCDATAETGARDIRRFACGIVSARASFEEAKALAEAALREFGCAAVYTPCEERPFLPGRAADAWMETSAGRAHLMRFGETHPEVLERFGIQNPTVLLEGDLALLAGVKA
ncbi:MAG: phenylalanine--tRNA ligase subunit beta [Candidatus Eisenbacteria bacterium]|nr:phenylalanine--tRNA ligase subunit beta [Candidatus Eisenbacteria bacterium]